MKKSLIIICLAFVLSILGMGAAAVGISSEREKVVIKENTLLGDVEAAKGLVVKTSTHSDYKLNWDTSFEIAKEVKAVTEFELDEWGREAEKPVVYEDELYLSYHTFFGGAGKNMVLEEWHYHEIFADVASRTPNGETRTETVTLADYYDYYELDLNIFWEKKNADFYTDAKKINEAIQIPIWPGEKLEITVGKSEDGGINSLNCNDVGRGMETNAHGVPVEGGCYFTCTPYYWDSENKKLIAAKGDARGLYYLPYQTSGDVKESEMEKPKKVVALSEDCMAVDLKKDENGNLLLFTKEQGKLFLTVYETGSLVQMQKQALLDMGETNRPYGVDISEEGVLVILGNGTFTFLTETESGTYDKKIEGDFTETDAGRSFWMYSDYSYNGEYLAIIGQDTQYSNLTGRSTNNIYVGIYGPEKTEYVGMFEHSAALDLLLYKSGSLEQRTKEGSLQVIWENGK